jgi:hypothetical protein
VSHQPHCQRPGEGVLATSWRVGAMRAVLRGASQAPQQMRRRIGPMRSCSGSMGGPRGVGVGGGEGGTKALVGRMRVRVPAGRIPSTCEFYLGSGCELHLSRDGRKLGLLCVCPPTPVQLTPPPLL